MGTCHHANHVFEYRIFVLFVFVFVFELIEIVMPYDHQSHLIRRRGIWSGEVNIANEANVEFSPSVHSHAFIQIHGEPTNFIDHLAHLAQQAHLARSLSRHISSSADMT